VWRHGLPASVHERQFDLKESAWSPEKGRPFVETDGRSVFIPAVMPDRDEAILAAKQALGSFRIEGIKTTLPLHLKILDDAGFAEGAYDVQHLNRPGLLAPAKARA
jgi:hypothetical protein